jgi:sugar phosphate isomerase/epimerase
MKLAVQHHLVPGTTLSEQFQRAAEFGFDGVELTAWGQPFGGAGTFSDHADAIDAAVRESGLPVSTLCSMGKDDYVHPDPAERSNRLNGLVRALRYADALGASGVIGLPVRREIPLPDLSPVADVHTLVTQLTVHTLREAIRQTPDVRARILLEPLNRYESQYLKTLAHARELCNAADSSRVQIMADLFHMSIEEASIPKALAANAPRIGHVHIADSNRLLPGHGHTDFAAAFRPLREAGYDGWFALECGVPGDPMQTLPEAVRYVRGQWDAAGER